MALIDPLSFGVVRTGYPVDTKTFTNNWSNPDGSVVTVSLTLSCRGLDNADGYVVIDQGNAMSRLYVPPDDPPEGYVQENVIELGGKAVAMSSEMCQSIANVLVAQDGSERYSFVQLAQYAVLLESAWYEVMVWVTSLGAKRKAQGKKP